jgi:adenylate cyclase
MQEAIDRMNEQRVAEGHFPLRVGMGIDTSINVAGWVGSSKALSYTVIGSGVNRASRLCGAAKAGEILVSEATMRRVYGRVVADRREPIALKGIAKPVPCYNVMDFVDPALSRKTRPIM